jgi:hypothetical protein
MPPRFGYGSSRSLLAVFLLALTCLACGRSQDRSAGEQRAPSDGGSLENGVYAILREASVRDSAHVAGRLYAILPYEAKYSEADADDPVIYVAIDTTSWVPLILEGAPEARPDGKGRTLLGVTLAREYVKAFEEFTTRHLGGSVAIVLDGEIVTMHKIRSIIREGKVQITRCDDNACEVLFAKLSK